MILHREVKNCRGLQGLHSQPTQQGWLPEAKSDKDAHFGGQNGG